MKYNEKGSVTMIVVVTILFIVILLSSFLIYTSARRRAQIKETEAISKAYDGDMNEIYNTKIADENVTIIEDTPIPKGFYYVGGTKEGGVVISDNKADENKYQGQEIVGTDDIIGNQFVWVPVSYEEYTNINTPGYGDKYDSESTSESNNIEESIKKYEGFYIGRYETGIENNNAVIKTGMTPYTNVDYNSAINIANSLYDEGNKDYGAISTLIHGKQWDSFLNNVKDKVDIENSSNWGNYATNNGVGRDKQNSITVDLQDDLEIMIPYYETNINANSSWLNKLNGLSIGGGDNYVNYYARILNNFNYENSSKDASSIKITPKNENKYIYNELGSTPTTRDFLYKSIINVDEEVDSSIILTIPSNTENKSQSIKYTREDNFIQYTNSEAAMDSDWGLTVEIDSNGDIISVMPNNRSSWNKESSINTLMSRNKKFNIQKIYISNRNVYDITILQEANSMENTGYSNAWSVNNVFDIAGNAEEWVRENSSTNIFSVRGGKYFVDGEERYANSRVDTVQTKQSSDLGFRVALYIK